MLLNLTEPVWRLVALVLLMVPVTCYWNTTFSSCILQLNKFNYLQGLAVTTIIIVKYRHLLPFAYRFEVLWLNWIKSDTSYVYCRTNILHVCVMQRIWLLSVPAVHLLKVLLHVSFNTRFTCFDCVCVAGANDTTASPRLDADWCQASTTAAGARARRTGYVRCCIRTHLNHCSTSFEYFILRLLSLRAAATHV